jgi:hypothetical protein
VVGVVAVIAAVALFTFSLYAFMLDARYFMGAHPWISLPAMLLIFALAFSWQFRRPQRRD